jgi:hypothetical protein
VHVGNNNTVQMGIFFKNTIRHKITRFDRNGYMDLLKPNLQKNFSIRIRRDDY